MQVGIRAIATSLSMFRSHGIQVFHLNDSNYWRPAEILAARLLRIPIITHYHIVMKKVGPFVKYCKIIVANSNFTAKESMPETVPKQVIYNCVDLKRFQSGRALRDELGIAQGLVVIAFAGQIRRIKGIDSFIKLAHRIDSPNVRFLIAGRCHDPQVLPGFYTEDELRWAIRNDSRIMYLGYRLDMENVYATSDIVVMPSTWDEPFGLVNIEAGAAAVPVVATAVGGIPEIIEHGVTGFLVARDDVDELAHYTKMLVDDPQRRGQMGKAARSLVEARFNHAPIRELEQLYVDLCA